MCYLTKEGGSSYWVTKYGGKYMLYRVLHLP
jgi:hypothetical protein